MRKIVRKMGDGLAVYFNREDQEVYKLKNKDVIEITITKVESNEEE